MKVLIDNYNGAPLTDKPTYFTYPRKVTCDRCGSKLEYNKEDTRVGYLGVTHLDCPLCGEEIMLEGNEQDITLTANNVKFPEHFWHTSKETGAVEVDEHGIKEYIRKGIEYLRENKDAFSWYAETGDSHIDIYRFEGDESYEIIVAKDFYSTEIPFEKEDY